MKETEESFPRVDFLFPLMYYDPSHLGLILIDLFIKEVQNPLFDVRNAPLVFSNSLFKLVSAVISTG